MKLIYMLVTNDIYELPVYMTEYLTVMADYLGMSLETCRWHFSSVGQRKQDNRIRAKLKYKFRKVRIKE